MLLSQSQADAIADIFSIGISRAADSLVEMVRDDISIDLPSIAVLLISDVNAWVTAKIHSKSATPTSAGCMPSAVLHFHGPLHGDLALLFSVQSANRLASALGIEPTADGLRETVEETANILLNAVAGSMANCLHHILTFDPPRYDDGPILLGTMASLEDPCPRVLLARTCFRLTESTIEGQILLHLDAASTEVLVASLDGVDTHQ